MSSSKRKLVLSQTSATCEGKKRVRKWKKKEWAPPDEEANLLHLPMEILENILALVCFSTPDRAFARACQRLWDAYHGLCTKNTLWSMPINPFSMTPRVLSRRLPVNTTGLFSSRLITYNRSYFHSSTVVSFRRGSSKIGEQRVGSYLDGMCKSYYSSHSRNGTIDFGDYICFSPEHAFRPGFDYSDPVWFSKETLEPMYVPPIDIPDNWRPVDKVGDVLLLEYGAGTLAEYQVGLFSISENRMTFTRNIDDLADYLHGRTVWHPLLYLATDGSAIVLHWKRFYRPSINDMVHGAFFMCSPNGGTRWVQHRCDEQFVQCRWGGEFLVKYGEKFYDIADVMIPWEKDSPPVPMGAYDTRPRVPASIFKGAKTGKVYCDAWDRRGRFVLCVKTGEGRDFYMAVYDPEKRRIRAGVKVATQTATQSSNPSAPALFITGAKPVIFETGVLWLKSGGEPTAMFFE